MNSRRTRNRTARAAALVAHALCIAARAAVADPPDRTPTAVPRLSGGFGRPRATLAAPPADDSGQGLTAVVHAAQQAREQNPEHEKSGLTINNKSLVTNKDKGRITTGRAAPALQPTAKATAAAARAPGAAPSSATTPAEPASSQGTEAEWKEIAHQDRKRVSDGKAKVAELTAAGQKLENDFYAWDDGQYRDRVIKPSWDKTREQLEDAKRELASAEKELADLPERARRAGALPGWIRE